MEDLMFRYKAADSTHIKIAREVTAHLASSLCLDQGILELWYDKVYHTLERLLSNSYTNEERRIYAQARTYRDVVRRLLAHPEKDKFLSKDDQRIIDEGLSNILKDLNQALSTSVSPTEISLFCNMAESGRELFRIRKIDPERFTEDNIFELALKIRSNYGAYEDTLRGLQV